MCWVSKKKPELMTAMEDIMVQKIMFVAENGSVISPMFGNPHEAWPIGKVKYGAICKPFKINESVVEGTWAYHITYGLHSCHKIAAEDGKWFSVSEKGSRDMLWLESDVEAVFDAVIPKGATYYLNGYGEYVSDMLMIVGRANS